MKEENDNVDPEFNSIKFVYILTVPLSHSFLNLRWIFGFIFFFIHEMRLQS